MIIKDLPNILKKQTGLKINFENIKKIDSSNNNQVFDLGNYILKVSKRNFNLKNEFTTLKKLEGKYFPKGLYYFEYENKYYLIILKLKGKTLDNYWLNYTEEKQQKVLGRITENLKVIHSIENQTFSFYADGEKEFSNYFDVLNYKLNTIKEKVFKNPFVNIDKLEKLLEIFYKNKDIFDGEKSVLVHNDLWYMNILANKDGFVGIIDFEESCFSPKQVELFRLYRHLLSAKNYLEKNPQDYKEIDFLMKFLSYLKKNYKELFNYTEKQKLIYDIISYFSMLSKFDETWYNHNDSKKFYKQIILQFT